VGELYDDRNSEEADMGDLIHEVYNISEQKIRQVISDLPKGKACGEDNISAELLHWMGRKA